jgi:hypothetical protein
MVSSMMEQFSQDSRARSRPTNLTLDDEYDEYDDGVSAVTSIYSSRVGSHRPPPPPLSSSARISPSRTYATDTELLRSPTEVLYAVSDHHQHLHRSGDRSVHSASSQTPQSQLQRHGRFGGRRPDGVHRSHHMDHHRSPYAREDNKENAYKARIQVTSPDSSVAGDPMTANHSTRKPYRTTINTANDNIVQHRPASYDAASSRSRGQQQQQLYQKNQTYRRPESEHYKVPRSRTPVEYNRHGQPMARNNTVTDSDHSSVYYNGAGERSLRGVRGSTGDPRRSIRGQDDLREHDREGRVISGRRFDRRRTYSGASTSPDRELSPARGYYSRPAAAGSRASHAPGPGPSSRSHSVLNRSPSSSPSRPPGRTRSSPGRDLLASVVRRVTNRGVERHPSRASSQRSPHRPAPSGGDGYVRRGNDHGGSSGRLRASTVGGGGGGGGGSGGGGGGVGGRRHREPQVDNSEERFARFTEYRADDDSDGPPPHVRPAAAAAALRRGTSNAGAYRGHYGPTSDSAEERERGRSLPPGATIDSMGDFYRSSQFKSMYALPPSPSRPAPVLDRAPSASTLVRRSQQQYRGMSDREDTPKDTARRRPDAPRPPARRPSSKRPAPSPPGRPPAVSHHQRVVSSDREDNRPRFGRQHSGELRRVASSDRGDLGPSNQGPPRRPSQRHNNNNNSINNSSSINKRPNGSGGDAALDSSFSESEGFVREQVIIQSLQKHNILLNNKLSQKLCNENNDSNYGELNH